MKYLIILITSTFLTTLSFAQGIDFFHGTWEEALEQAKAEDKIIFVDAYTTWCGPCKKMSKSVFTQKEVGDYFNQHFVALKLDMEKEQGRKFGRSYPVSAYPTFYFIDGNGETVLTTKGAMGAEKFIALGTSAVSKVDYSADFAKEYEKGNRDPELVFNYVKALNKSGKSSLKVANDYIKTQKDLTTPENIKFLIEATTQADSRIFGLLVKNKAQAIAATDEATVNGVIEKACKKTAQKAIEFNSEDLQKEAKTKMKQHLPGKAEVFANTSDMEFYKAAGDANNYLKSCMCYAKKTVKSDASQLNLLASDINKNFSDDTKAMKQAEKMAKKAAENGGLYNYYFTYADILSKNGKKQEALKMAQKSLDLVKGNRMEEMTIKQLIQKIEKS